MNEDKKTEIKVGVTIFIALIIFGLVFGWAKNYSFSSNNFPLTVDFNTVAGLENGDLVSVNGVRKGSVKSITSNANAARVEIVFDEDPNLKEDATFSIMMLDLMGGKQVEISRGASNTDLDYSRIHLGNFFCNIDDKIGNYSKSKLERSLEDVRFKEYAEVEPIKIKRTF